MNDKETDRLQKTVTSVLEEVLQIEPTRVNLQTSFVADLGIDSMGMIEVLMVLEEKLGVCIYGESMSNFEELQGIKKVEDLVNVVKDRVEAPLLQS